MTPAQVRAQNIIERYNAGATVPEIMFYESCGKSLVYRVLRNANLLHNMSRSGYEPSPGEPELVKGMCAMCKAGYFTHPDWVDGVCPTCQGTGKYPGSIMNCRRGTEK